MLIVFLASASLLIGAGLSSAMNWRRLGPMKFGAQQRDAAARRRAPRTNQQRLHTAPVVVGLAASAGLAACAALPNTGLPGDMWSGVDGLVATDIAVEPVLDKGSGVYRAIRPSRSEQGIVNGDWAAAYVVLVPASQVESPKGRPPFSNDVATALRTCATNLGSFADTTSWTASPDIAFKTGKVHIGSEYFYQYVTYLVTWHVVVSDTGRGYRLSGLQAQYFGSIAKVRQGSRLKSTVAVAFDPVDRDPQEGLDTVQLNFMPLASAPVQASCTAAGLQISGPAVTQPNSRWFEGIQKQPFNVAVTVTEEVQ